MEHFLMRNKLFIYILFAIHFSSFAGELNGKKFISCYGLKQDELHFVNRNTCIYNQRFYPPNGFEALSYTDTCRYKYYKKDSKIKIILYNKKHPVSTIKKFDDRILSKINFQPNLNIFYEHSSALSPIMMEGAPGFFVKTGYCSFANMNFSYVSSFFYHIGNDTITTTDDDFFLLGNNQSPIPIPFILEDAYLKDSLTYNNFSEYAHGYSEAFEFNNKRNHTQLSNNEEIVQLSGKQFFRWKFTKETLTFINDSICEYRQWGDSTTNINIDIQFDTTMLCQYEIKNTLIILKTQQNQDSIISNYIIKNSAKKNFIVNNITCDTLTYSDGMLFYSKIYSQQPETNDLIHEINLYSPVDNKTGNVLCYKVINAFKKSYISYNFFKGAKWLNLQSKNNKTSLSVR